jgi:hypothetical protein
LIFLKMTIFYAIVVDIDADIKVNIFHLWARAHTYMIVPFILLFATTVLNFVVPAGAVILS